MNTPIYWRFQDYNPFPHLDSYKIYTIIIKYYASHMVNVCAILTLVPYLYSLLFVLRFLIKKYLYGCGCVDCWNPGLLIY